jgi:hypothetical protein
MVHYYWQLIKMLPKELPIAVYLVNDGSSKGINEQDIQFLAAEIPHFHFIDLKIDDSNDFIKEKSLP